FCFFFFFFSSRRRHTRSDRDWSSDVCSSDLSCYGSARLGAGSRSRSSCRRLSGTILSFAPLSFPPSHEQLSWLASNADRRGGPRESGADQSWIGRGAG